MRQQMHKIKLDIAASIGVWGGRFEKTYIDAHISTHMLLPTGTTCYLSATGKMNVSKSDSLSKGLERWNTLP